MVTRTLGLKTGLPCLSPPAIPYFSRLLEDSISCMHIAPAWLLTRPPMQLLRLGFRPATVTPPLTSITFMLPMPMPTRERYARRPSKWALPSKESCMNECKGYSMANGVRLSIPSKTHCREDKRLSRVLVDLGGNKHVASIGGTSTRWL